MIPHYERGLPSNPIKGTAAKARRIKTRPKCSRVIQYRISACERDKVFSNQLTGKRYEKRNEQNSESLWTMQLTQMHPYLKEKRQRLPWYAFVLCLVFSIPPVSYDSSFFFSSHLLSSPFFFCLPPSRNSDPGSHINSRLFFPPLHYGSCLAFLSREDFSSFL